MIDHIINNFFIALATLGVFFGTGLVSWAVFNHMRSRKPRPRIVAVFGLNDQGVNSYLMEDDSVMTLTYTETLRHGWMPKDKRYASKIVQRGIQGR